MKKTTLLYGLVALMMTVSSAYAYPEKTTYKNQSLSSFFEIKKSVSEIKTIKNKVKSYNEVNSCAACHIE